MPGSTAVLCPHPASKGGVASSTRLAATVRRLERSNRFIVTNLADYRAPGKQLPWIALERRRLRSFHEILRVAAICWCQIGRELARRAIHIAEDHADGRSPLLSRARCEDLRFGGVVAREHLAPHRRGQRSAGGTRSDRRRLVEAEPDAGDQIGREAD